MITYQIEVSEDFMIEGHRRCRRTRRFARVFQYARWPVAVAVAFLGMIAFAVARLSLVGAVVPALLVALLVFGDRIDEWIILRRFRRSPHSSLRDARQTMEEWRRDYNQVRRHGSLGNQAPEDYARTHHEASLCIRGLHAQDRRRR